eukprot:CAMPEP_0185830394 /NCGR_PEP_ID=MMETSP1353-20130828/824_1 /TAXON_ID=1077150 /ORGANISM="Erythrolobus australicus, Strain CCMP3124" /LENGTH=151 /DNA_ID=CAMNT_0028528297 /DNA_START=626 /DNA_END=1081 /DNA_ORIENTATION=+
MWDDKFEQGLVECFVEGDECTQLIKAEPHLATDNATESEAASLTVRRAPSMFSDEPCLLDGALSRTTAVAAKRMSPKEREIVLANRKIRNRESARRSRAKKDIALRDLTDRKLTLERTVCSQSEVLAHLLSENMELQEACAHLRPTAAPML